MKPQNLLDSSRLCRPDAWPAGDYAADAADTVCAVHWPSRVNADGPGWLSLPGAGVARPVLTARGGLRSSRR
jgi:hypothetical protein